MNKSVGKFLSNLKIWKEETEAIRKILLSTELEEDFKWNLPCYTFNGQNVIILQPFKPHLGVMFFKGSLLKDPKGVLHSPGPNSHIARRFEFTSIAEIKKLEATFKKFIKDAISIEEKGEKVVVKREPQAIPAELKSVFAKKPAVKKAFEALTPGRQRAYIYHISSAKQAATRVSRVEKCVPDILKGKGLNEP